MGTGLKFSNLQNNIGIKVKIKEIFFFSCEILYFFLVNEKICEIFNFVILKIYITYLTGTIHKVCSNMKFNTLLLISSTTCLFSVCITSEESEAD